MKVPLKGSGAIWQSSNARPMEESMGAVRSLKLRVSKRTVERSVDFF